MEITEVLKFVQPEMLIIIPVLIFIGSAMKKSPLSDWTIPLWLGAIGIVLATCLFGIQEGFTLETFIKGILQGIMCTGMAVYLHQLKIQTTEKRTEDQNRWS